jgi:hypothetical protein
VRGGVVNFADHSGNSKHWTPKYALETALADLESGELATRDGQQGKVIQLAVHYYVEYPDGRLRPSHYVAGMTSAEYVALLTLSLQKAIDDWRAG